MYGWWRHKLTPASQETTHQPVFFKSHKNIHPLWPNNPSLGSLSEETSFLKRKEGRQGEVTCIKIFMQVLLNSQQKEARESMISSRVPCNRNQGKLLQAKLQLEKSPQDGKWEGTVTIIYAKTTVLKRHTEDSTIWWCGDSIKKKSPLSALH